MEEIFSELLDQNKVIGVLYLSLEGKILFQKLHQPADRDWPRSTGCPSSSP
jgi:hypothetical protein